MPRRRLAVALLVPGAVGREIAGLRRALADPDLGRVPSHITLVPPVNVNEGNLAEALALLRAAAASRPGPLTVDLGPVATFQPDSPTIHLAVDDASGAVAALRVSVLRSPLERTSEWPFVPHVTLVASASVQACGAAVDLLDGYRVSVEVPSVHLLEERPDAGWHRRWVPLAEASLGPQAVVARGPRELTLSITSLAGPDVDEFLRVTLGSQEGEAGDAVTGAGEPVSRGPGGRAPAAVGWWHVDHVGAAVAPGVEDVEALVVAARRDGVVGVAVGRTWGPEAGLAGVLVAADDRGEGVGRHLVDQFVSAAARRGCRRATADIGPEAALLQSAGWTLQGATLVREC